MQQNVVVAEPGLALGQLLAAKPLGLGLQTGAHPDEARGRFPLVRPRDGGRGPPFRRDQALRVGQRAAVGLRQAIGRAAGRCREHGDQRGKENETTAGHGATPSIKMNNK